MRHWFHWFQKPLLLLCAFLFLSSGAGNASHNCPKPPKKGGLFGFFITTTFLPSATAAAVTRSLNTSGCKNGHASESFYKPDVVSEYLRDNLDFVAEETAQGQGGHLETLAMLMGCASPDFPLFAETLQRHYTRIFPATVAWAHTEQAIRTQHQIIKLIEQTPALQTGCAAIH